MESQQQKQLRVQLERKLVHDLHTMRDTLSHLSLLLHDLQFEVDDCKRQAAAAQVTDCIARCQWRRA
jgi:hypothetical protein